MLTDQAQPSLMDDVDFLEELAKLEQRSESTRRPLAAEPWLAPDTPDELAPDGLDLGEAWQTRPTFVELPESSPASETSAGQIALGIGGFLLMMCVGAAGAALVFHARLAQIFH